MNLRIITALFACLVAGLVLTADASDECSAVRKYCSRLCERRFRDNQKRKENCLMECSLDDDESVQCLKEFAPKVKKAFEDLRKAASDSGDISGFQTVLEAYKKVLEEGRRDCLQPIDEEVLRSAKK